MEAFVGSILPIAFTFAPQDFNYCNGQELSVAQYQAVFSLLGATYGGNSNGTLFNLPNLAGRIPIGSNSMGPGKTGAASINLGQYGGSQTAVVAHTHPANVTISGMSVTLPPFNATVNASTQLNVSTQTGDQPVPNNGSYLAGFTGAYGREPVTGNIYSSTAGTTVALSGASTSATATVTPAGTATLSGGSSGIIVGNNSNPSQNSLPPYLAISFIICMQGLYPMRD